MIIGISGKIGSGKDTVGEIIQYLCALPKIDEQMAENPTFDRRKYFDLVSFSGWEVKKFAGKLKEIVALLTGCKISDLESQEFKNQELGQNWWTYKHLTADYKCIQKSCNVLDNEELNLLGDRITKPTYRYLLQVIGTDCMRNIVGENVWVNALFSDYKPKSTDIDTPVYKNAGLYMKDKVVEVSFPNWIITDTRFPNEANAIKQNGGILIRVNRGEQSTEGHASETSLDNYEFNYVINNDGTIGDLIEKVRKILLQENILQ